MNSKRVKYATLATSVKEEVVPVLIHDPESDGGEPQYAYATFATSDETEAAVVTLSERHHEALANAQEVIIDENGHAVTLQQLVENSTVEEVETVEEGDGTHTILHIVPSSSLSDDQEVGVGVEGEVYETGDSVDAVDCVDGNIGTIDSEGQGSNDAYGPRSKTFYCPNCGNCYSAAGSLKLHMRACMRQRQEVPPDERKCEVCNKVFNSVSYLKEHMLRHTGEQPHRCHRCYRKFLDMDKFKAHLETHKHQDKLDAEAEAISAQHGGRKVVLKEFTCSFCSDNFTVVFEVGNVKRRYACDACREKYSNAETLKQHKQMVDDKREFSCERCGRKFVFEGFLQRHLPTCDGSIKRRRDMK